MGGLGGGAIEGGGRHQLMMSDIHSSLPGDGRKRSALYTKVGWSTDHLSTSTSSTFSIYPRSTPALRQDVPSGNGKVKGRKEGMNNALPPHHTHSIQRARTATVLLWRTLPKSDTHSGPDQRREVASQELGGRVEREGELGWNGVTGHGTWGMGHYNTYSSKSLSLAATTVAGVLLAGRGSSCACQIQRLFCLAFGLPCTVDEW